jgi:hypothetical protein
VLDWGLAHVGDRSKRRLAGGARVAFRARQARDGGLCGREFWNIYSDGSAVSRRAWWEIFGDWKWAIICVLQQPV